MSSSSSSNPSPPGADPPPAATTTKDAFCLLKINKKGMSTGKGKRDYSFLHDAFKQTASGIECVVCGPGPGGFSFAWDDLDPPDGTQRQLNKGNLALHVEKNQKHHERAKALADKASWKAGGGGFLSYFKTATSPPHPPGVGADDGDGDAVGVGAAAVAGGAAGEGGEEPQEGQPPVLESSGRQSASGTSVEHPPVLEGSGRQSASGTSVELVRELVAGSYRCIGYLPPELAGTKTLLIDTPVAPFYPNSSIGKRSLSHRIELRANGFFAKKYASSPGCHVVVERENLTCEACQSLDYEQALNQVLSISKESPKDHVSSNRHLGDLPITHLKARVEHQKRRAGLANLTVRRTERKVQSLGRTVGLHEQIQVLLTEHNVPGLQVALVQAAKRNLGAKAILDVIGRCIKRTYKPKAGFSKEDVDMATLILRLAGPVGLFALRQMLRLPTSSYLYKWSCLAAFTPVIFKPLMTYKQAVQEASVANFRAFFMGRIASGDMPWEEAYSCGWMLAMDEVATDEKIRYSPNGNCLLGTCCQHRPLTLGTVFGRLGEAEKVFTCLEQGLADPKAADAMHMAKECSVLAVMTMSGGASTCRLVPLAAVGTCKKDSVEQNVEMMEAVLDAWAAVMEEMRQKHGKALGPILRLATDGDGKRRQAVTRLCNAQPLQDLAREVSREVQDCLEAMILFDCYGGAYDITVDFDGRHMLKRLRFRLISTGKGIQLYDGGVVLNKGTLKLLFDAAKVSDYAENLFDDNDKQNVPSAVKLLKMVDEAGKRLSTDPSQSSAVGTTAEHSVVMMAQDASLLGTLLTLIMKPILGGVDDKKTEVDLTEALIAAAAASHILFVIFSKQGSRFIPSQLYHDLQSTIKALFMDVAKLLHEHGLADLNFFLLGTNELEKLFGILRSLFTGRGFDVKELGERMGAAIDLHRIKKENPSWDGGQRRLSVKGSDDRVNIASWVGSTSMEGDVGILQSLWVEGCTRALAAFDLHPYYGARMENGLSRAADILRRGKEAGCTMMRVDGKLVGVGVRKEESEEVDDVAELRGASNSGTDDGEAIGVISEEWVDAATGLDVDLTDSSQDDIANAMALVRQERGREAEGLGRPRTRPDMVAMAMDDGGEVQVSKTAAVVKLGVRFRMEGLVKSSDRLRRVCGLPKINTGSCGGARLTVVEEDVDQVQPFSPVLVLVKTDTRTDQNRKYVTMSMGVGIITTLTNKSHGSGPLFCIPEPFFATAETKVDVHLVAVSAAEEEGFFIIHTNEVITDNPLPFNGDEFVSLVKPQVVMDEESGKTFYRLKKKDLERQLKVFGELFEDLRCNNVLPQRLPQGPSKVLPEPVEKEMLLVEKESNEKVCCVCKDGKSIMYWKHMRHHVAGHVWKGKGESFIKKVGGLYTFDRPCGFCGVPSDVGGCTIDILTKAGNKGKDKRVVVSSCGLKLDGMKFDTMEKTRNEELEARVEAEEDGKAVQIKLTGFPVANMPVMCPFPRCSAVVWKYNLMAHMCGAHIHLFGERNQRWRKRAALLVANFVCLLSDVEARIVVGKKGGKKCHKMTEETQGKVGLLLDEMRELVPGELGIKLAFNLEELARESDCALDAYENFSGPLAHRASAKRPRKEKGTRGGGAKGVVQHAGETTQAEEMDVGDGGEARQEEEEEAAGEGEGDSISICSLHSSSDEDGGGKEVVVEGDSSSSSDSDDSGEDTRPRKVARRKR